MKNRAQQYDFLSLIFVIVGILGLIVCAFCAINQNYKMACLIGVAGLLSARIGYRFARLALAAEGRKAPHIP